MSDFTATRPAAGKIAVSEPLAVASVATAAVLVVVWGMSIGYTDVDVWGAFAVPTILAAITLPFLTRSRWLREEGLVGIASIALVAKFVGTYLRYVVEFYVYPGGDSMLYHQSGVRIAEDILDGQRSIATLVPRSTGTQFIEELNGIVSLISGRSLMASFMVFSWLAYLGLLCFVAAARRACVGIRTRPYAIALLFLPSMLFWTSALGKDAWMIFGMGLFAAGVARLLTGSVAGLAGSLTGGYVTAQVRPHVTALLLMAVATSLFGRRLGVRRSVSLLVLPLVAGLVGVVSANSAQLLPGFDAGVDAVLSGTLDRTSIGGSEFEAAAANSLVDYPYALLTVLFRPFIFEVNSAVQVISALEGTCLFLWIMSRRRQLAASFASIIDVAYLRMSLVFVLGFGFAWASVGNLGILVRQRAQVIPLLLVLVFVAERQKVSPIADHRRLERVR